MRKKKNTLQEPSYIPISNVKQTLEIPEKQINESDLITIEKTGRGKKSRIKAIKLKERKITEDEEAEAEEMGIKGNYTLIITEKPQAALKIASALGSPEEQSSSGPRKSGDFRGYRKYNEKGAPYYELTRNNKKIIVACAVGHLLNLESKEKGWPIFNISWQPSFKRNVWIKKYYSALSKLAKNASEFIVATDYDVEGEVIGWNIIRFIAKQKDAKRMKFSTLTANELENSYKNLMPTIDWGQAVAGETRHFLDWMYGINLSRALMSAIKKAGSFKIMSIGRVQGPALHLIVEKELEIQKFVSQPYWQVYIKIKGHNLILKYEKDIFDKKLLAEFENLEGRKGLASTEKSSRRIPPGVPFDLTSLQREAYRLLGINPARTLQLAQNLYLAGLISYPRTSSQKIPEAINPKAILKKLSSNFKQVSFVSRNQPAEGKKSDPAHPSIYPTGESGDITEEEFKLYSLIVKRFISCFCSDAEIEDKKIIFDCENKKFIARGLAIKEKGWMNVYPAILQEKEVEDINGQKIVDKKIIEEKETMPPHRYTPASIITELEKRNLGTKATRSAIIETLYNRNYIKEQSIEATPLGISLIETLEKNSPVIIDEELTRHFEREMDSIQKTKKNLFEKQEKTIKEAKESIIKISDDFKKKEEKIGKELVLANKEIYKQEREANTLTQCPVCKKGNLRILFNKKFKRYFLGCSAYPECKTTFSLPPNSLIKPAGKTCEKCGFPLLLAIRKAKRPWEFCFNPQCSSNAEWQKRKEESKNKESNK